jgi:hypothetical protein
VEFHLGFRGATVADAWNPFLLTTRDVGSGTLTLRIDRGSLLEGEILWVIEVPVVGGAGLRVVEGDLYIPSWRSFVWSYEAGGRVLASGSYARELADPRPLDLVVASNPSLAAHLGSERRIDVLADDLPVRVAAYDGVRTIWLDGSLPLPSPAAMTAAAVAGSLVMVLGSAAEDRAWAPLMADASWRAIGAGGWWTGEAPSPEAVAGAYLPRAEILAAFVAEQTAPTPPRWPRGSLLLALFGYVLFVSLAWRAGGIPGLLSLLVVVGAASVAGYALLGDQSPQLRASRALRIEGGSLAQVIQVHDVRTLPDARVTLPLLAQPAVAMAGDMRLGGDPVTAVVLTRGRAASLHEPPTAVPLASEPSTSGLAAPKVLTAALPSGTHLMSEGESWRVQLPERVRW